MRVGVISADPGHPLLSATATALRRDGHRVEFVDLDGTPLAPDGTSDGDAAPGTPADVYLLKARTPEALACAARLEDRGVPVINSTSATAGCQDRVAMAEVARAAGLPFAETVRMATVGELAASGTDLDFPLVLKSRHSRRDDLVTRVDTPTALVELAATWADEPVVVQEFTANSGWDHKLWIVDGQPFAARRRSELSPGGRGPNQPLPPAALPTAWIEGALRAGEVFGLEVYGVDILHLGVGAPLFVDINAFPGIRGQVGAPETLAALALRRAGGGAGR
ncbi:RimK family alpha-L-glutamate ligase [Streptomyces sp. NPDC058000]|uniref:ATP-grasp domain-containing protein n=1 Tax=Streptomyces sp. NPDC058000 TaxID=3346299 RepID=UPI0036E5E7CF